MKRYIRLLLLMFCITVVVTVFDSRVQASVLDDIEAAEEIEVGMTYDVVLDYNEFKWYRLVTEDEYKTYTFSFPSTRGVRLCICDQNVADIKTAYGSAGDTTTFNPGLNEVYYISLYNQYTTPTEVLFNVSTVEDAPNVMDDAQSFEPGELIDGAISSEVDKDWFAFTTGDYEEEYTFFTTLVGKGTYTFGIYTTNRKELAKVTCSDSNYVIYSKDYTNTVMLDKNETYYLCFEAHNLCEYSFEVTKNVAKTITDSVSLELKAKKNGFLASWNVIASAKGYEMQYSTDSSLKKAKKLTIAKKSKKICGLKNGTSYYVRVRAYAKNSEGKKIYTKWSGIKKITV